MKNLTTDKGFTIIETLVAITVLMIAIAGPLVVANKGLTGAIVSKDQMTASYLAQESMEAIKNIRDNNVQQLGPSSWLTGFNVSSQCNSASNLCDASAIDAPTITNAAAQMYVSANGYYSHTGSAIRTPFIRSFYLSAPGLPGSPCQAASNECTVNVMVNWNEGINPYRITLVSELTSAAR